MKSVPCYSFFRTKYGDELLIDIVQLKDIRTYLQRQELHVLTYFDITLITEGTGLFRIDDRSYHVRPGDVVFSSPNEIRAWDIRHIMNGYALIFEEEFLLSFFSDPNFINNLSYFDKQKATEDCISLKKQESDYLLSLFRRISAEITDYKTKDKHILRALLYLVLKHLDRLYTGKVQLSAGSFATQNRHVCNFMTLVDRHFSSQHSIGFYADELCITPDHLNKLVKAHTGNNAGKIIHDKLIIEARRQLLYSSLSVTEIAEMLHFDNASYFIRFFRKKTGKSPLQYRISEKP